MIRYRSKLAFIFIVLAAGCSQYRVVLQGIELDRFTQSLPSARPDLAAHHNDLGVILEQDGDHLGALQQYRLAAEKDPEFTLAYFNAGNVSVKLNRLDEAVRYYRTALKTDPEYAPALNNLAWTYIIRGENLPGAIKLLNRAIQVDAGHPYLYLDSLGWAYYLKGESEQARDCLERALEKTPEVETYLRQEAHYHLARVYRDMGEVEKAAGHFRRCLQLNPPSQRIEEIKDILKSTE